MLINYALLKKLGLVIFLDRLVVPLADIFHVRPLLSDGSVGLECLHGSGDGHGLLSNLLLDSWEGSVNLNLLVISGDSIWSVGKDTSNTLLGLAGFLWQQDEFLLIGLQSLDVQHF